MNTHPAKTYRPADRCSICRGRLNGHRCADAFCVGYLLPVEAEAIVRQLTESVR